MASRGAPEYCDAFAPADVPPTLDVALRSGLAGRPDEEEGVAVPAEGRPSVRLEEESKSGEA